MKTMAMIVVMLIASTAQAETDAEKVARLEKENIELRNQVQAQKQAIAILQRKIEALTKPAAKVDAKEVKPAAPVKSFASIKAMVDSVPKELHGSDNAAAGEKFSREKWNAWLKENAVGKQLSVKQDYFDGQVVRIDTQKKFNGIEIRESDKGYYFAINEERSWAHVFFPESAKGIVASLQAGDSIIVTGVIREAAFRFDSSPPTMDHHVVLENCTVKVLKRKP